MASVGGELAADDWDDFNQFKIDKKLTIILAALAMAFILAHLWLGPIYGHMMTVSVGGSVLGFHLTIIRD
jgi:hypothetical protein